MRTTLLNLYHQFVTAMHLDRLSNDAKINLVIGLEILVSVIITVLVLKHHHQIEDVHGDFNTTKALLIGLIIGIVIACLINFTSAYVHVPL